MITRHWHAPPDLRNYETYAATALSTSSQTFYITSISSEGKMTVSLITTALHANLFASSSETGIKLKRSENSDRDSSLNAFG